MRAHEAHLQEALVSSEGHYLRQGTPSSLVFAIGLLGIASEMEEKQNVADYLYLVGSGDESTLPAYQTLCINNGYNLL